MSDGTCSSYDFVPVLTKENYMIWELQVEAYLMGEDDHFRVLQPTKDSEGFHNPSRPSDAEEGKAWDQSERVARGVIMATASDLYLELIGSMRGESVWKLWKAIEAKHQQYNESLRAEAWMQLLAIRKKPDEAYMDFFRRVEAARLKINQFTPQDFTTTQYYEELRLFAFINGLHPDDPLRRQLVSESLLGASPFLIAELGTILENAL